MVAYSFRPRFAPLIESGAKTQTIRAPRRRHALPGERLQLFTGMRTRQCRKLIPDPRCVAVTPILLWPENGRWLGRIPGSLPGGVRFQVDDAFAREDGFSDAADFGQFWAEAHGVAPFSGYLIRWAP